MRIFGEEWPVNHTLKEYINDIFRDLLCHISILSLKYMILIFVPSVVEIGNQPFLYQFIKRHVPIEPPNDTEE